MIVAIYAFSTFVDVLFGGFMGEALLICPIKALIRVVGLITHLAAEDLLMSRRALALAVLFEPNRDRSNSSHTDFGC